MLILLLRPTGKADSQREFALEESELLHLKYVLRKLPNCLDPKAFITLEQIKTTATNWKDHYEN